jgi:hypothetical protein
VEEQDPARIPVVQCERLAPERMNNEWESSVNRFEQELILFHRRDISVARKSTFGESL